MIRLATPSDVPTLLDLGRAFNEEAGYAETVPFDADSFAVTLAALGRAELLIVAENDGNVVGMAGADIGPSICNHAVMIARETFWYVHPEHRKGVGKKLLNALECQVKNLGAMFFDMVAEVGKRDLPLARVYAAGGFSPAERIFRKRLG